MPRPRRCTRTGRIATGKTTATCPPPPRPRAAAISRAQFVEFAFRRRHRRRARRRSREVHAEHDGGPGRPEGERPASRRSQPRRRMAARASRRPLRVECRTTRRSRAMHRACSACSSRRTCSSPPTARRTSAGEPTLAEMTTRRDRAPCSATRRATCCVVEGGRIDHAHHDGNARRALEETVAFSDAVRAADEMTSGRRHADPRHRRPRAHDALRRLPGARQSDPRQGARASAAKTSATARSRSTSTACRTRRSVMRTARARWRRSDAPRRI